MAPAAFTSTIWSAAVRPPRLLGSIVIVGQNTEGRGVGTGVELSRRIIAGRRTRAMGSAEVSLQVDAASFLTGKGTFRVVRNDSIRVFSR